MPPHILPIVLLSISNLFMTLAWYGHLKFKAAPLLLVIFVSWGIAFFEYCLAVPANRWGHSVYSAAELKTIQEVDHPCRLCRIFGLGSEGAARLEPRNRVRPHRARRLVHLPGQKLVWQVESSRRSLDGFASLGPITR